MIYISYTTDPAVNLAVEEYLLDHCTSPTLYLWQNENTIVIGRHQNPFRELDVTAFVADGGKIVRRLSGGGAVFHDMGNLNFTFLFPRDQYDQERTTETLLSAVRSLGIPAERTGRNDLAADGRKFSGNAYCNRKDSAYHHGTLLVSADMGKLSRYLTVDPEKLQSKGVKSVRSRVINLRELMTTLTIEALQDAVRSAFLAEFGGDAMVYDTASLPTAEITALTEKYRSWDWTYGQSPAFGIALSRRFVWGGVRLGLDVQQGRVAAVSVETDAMDTAVGETIPAVLQNVPYNAVDVAHTLHQTGVPELLDIGDWLKQEI